MARYYIRSAEGILKGEINGAIADKIFNQDSGHFGEKNLAKDGKVTVFIIDVDSTYGRDEFRIFLWKNDYIVQQRG